MIFGLNHNYVRLAVNKLGGPTKAAHAAGVSNTTIHSWIKQRRIKDIEKARVIAKLTKIDIEDLRGTK